MQDFVHVECAVRGARVKKGARNRREEFEVGLSMLSYCMLASIDELGPGVNVAPS